MSDVSTNGVIDPKTTASYRIMRAVVIILGVLIALALAGVVAGVAMRMSGHTPRQTAAAGQFELPAGSQIQSTQVAGDNVVVTVKTESGAVVYVFNADDGHLIGRIAPKGR